MRFIKRIQNFVAKEIFYTKASRKIHLYDQKIIEEYKRIGLKYFNLDENERKQQKNFEKSLAKINEYKRLIEQQYKQKEDYFFANTIKRLYK